MATPIRCPKCRTATYAVVKRGTPTQLCGACGHDLLARYETDEDEHANYRELVQEDREHPERIAARKPEFLTPAICPCGCGATPATISVRRCRNCYDVLRPDAVAGLCYDCGSGPSRAR